MPSVRDDIKLITKNVTELSAQARKAADNTKDIGNSLKYASTEEKVGIIKDQFKSLAVEVDKNTKLITAMKKAQSELKANMANTKLGYSESDLQKLQAEYDKLEVQIARIEEKNKNIGKLLKEQNQTAVLQKAIQEQVNEQFSKAEERAKKLNRVALSLVTNLTKIVTSSIETGKEVYSMSKRFNSSAEDVQIWNRALELATGTQDIFNDSMKAMIQGMSQISAGRGIAYNNVLKAIGVNYSEIASLTPTEQFEAIINGLAGVENYSIRAGYAQQLFQEKGVLLAGALEGGAEEIEEFKRQAQEFGIISDENAQRLVEVGFELEKAKSQLSVVGAELTIGVAPVLQIITTGLKVVQPILSAIANGLEKMGVVGGLLVTTGLTAMIIMPKIIMFSKQHRIARLLEAQAIEKVAVAQKGLSIGLGGWLGIAAGAIGIISALIGAFSKAKDEADGLNDSLNETITKGQGIVGSAANDFTTTTEQMATKTTTYELIIDATIHGEGDTPISDENAMNVAILTTEEINKALGDLVK